MNLWSPQPESLECARTVGRPGSECIGARCSCFTFERWSTFCALKPTSSSCNRSAIHSTWTVFHHFTFSDFSPRSKQILWGWSLHELPRSPRVLPESRVRQVHHVSSHTLSELTESQISSMPTHSDAIEATRVPGCDYKGWYCETSWGWNFWTFYEGCGGRNDRSQRRSHDDDLDIIRRRRIGVCIVWARGEERDSARIRRNSQIMLYSEHYCTKFTDQEPSSPWRIQKTTFK